MNRYVAQYRAGLDALAADQRVRTRRIVHSAQGPHIDIEASDHRLRRPVLSFASNDYLGLADDPRIAQAFREGIDCYGVGAGASHLLGGHFASHHALEAAAASFAGFERALYFSTGYMANLAAVTALAGRGDAVFSDKLNHACLNDGAFLSRAEFKRYAHGDLAQLEALLASSSCERKLITTDAVFSMDGDIADIAALLALAERYDALLLIDDAHGFGVLGQRGRGTLEHLGLLDTHGRCTNDRIVYMATLGKAAGVSGAFVAGSDAIIEWILQTARPYIFTTAAPPAICHALLKSLDIIASEPERRERLRELIAQLRNGLAGSHYRLLPSNTAIQPIIVGDNAAALSLAEALLECDIWAPAIRPPTVPAGTARLRISLSAAHTSAQVQKLVDALHDVEHIVAEPNTP